MLFLCNELFCFYSFFETCFHEFLYKISEIGNIYFVIIIIRKAYQLEKETRQTKQLFVFGIIPSLHGTCFLPDQIVNDPIVLPKNLNPRLKNLIEGLLSKGKMTFNILSYYLTLYFARV